MKKEEKQVLTDCFYKIYCGHIVFLFIVLSLIIGIHLSSAQQRNVSPGQRLFAPRHFQHSGLLLRSTLYHLFYSS